MLKRIFSIFLIGLIAVVLTACSGEEQRLSGFTIEDADGGYAIAFPKDSELTEAFNKTLQEMKTNGDIDAIIKKWFDTESNEDKEESNDSSSGNAEQKVLKIATSADYPPFEFIDTENSGDYIGLDIDIANAITKELGYKLEIQDMDFGGLISALQNGQADFVMAAMSATDERKESVDFSDVYYTSKHFIISKEDSGIQTKEDLKGKKVGAQMGSIQEEKGQELAEEIGFTLENRNRVPELIQEIMAGRLDAAIIEDTVAQGYLE